MAQQPNQGGQSWTLVPVFAVCTLLIIYAVASTWLMKNPTGAIAAIVIATIAVVGGVILFVMRQVRRAER